MKQRGRVPGSKNKQPLSAEARQRMKLAQIQRRATETLSPETLAKMSAAATAREAARRQRQALREALFQALNEDQDVRN
jgi:hypothetical protein